jgi:hypothetical protein
MPHHHHGATECEPRGRPRPAARGPGAILLLALLTISLGAACARVPPHQRGRLAHPTMLLKDLAGPAESHVYAIHEGAIGGGTGAEGGCGCN